MFSESFSPKSAIVSIWRTRVLQIESSPNLYPTNFLASQAAHGADVITTMNFLGKVNTKSVCGVLVDALIYY